jgi:hypothetical protein
LEVTYYCFTAENGTFSEMTLLKIKGKIISVIEDQRFSKINIQPLVTLSLFLITKKKMISIYQETFLRLTPCVAALKSRID